MEAIREYFTIDDSAFDPLQRRRIRAINSLNIFTIGLLILMTLVFLTADIGRLQLNIMAIDIGLGLVTIFWVRHLLQQAKFTLGAVVYITYYLIIMVGAVLRYGPQNPSSMLALALPIILTAALMGRRSVIVVTGVAIAFNEGLALLQKYVWLMSGDFMKNAMGDSLLILFVGAVAFYLVNELLASYEAINQEETSLNTTLKLGQQISAHRAEDALLQDFGTIIQTTFDLQQIQIFLREPDNPSILNLRSGTGLAAQRAQGRTFSIAEENVLTIAMNQSEPVVARISDLAYMQSELLPGSTSQLAIPIYGYDNVLGVVDFQSANEWYFTERRIDLFQALTFEFGTLVSNLHLKTSMEATQSEHAELYAKVANYRAEVMRLRRQVSGIVWDRFFQEQGSEVLGFDLEPGAADPVENDTISSSMETTLKAGAVDVRPTNEGYLLALPIVLRGQVLGALEFTIVRDTMLPSHIIDLATTITERLSLALDNARLVQETQAFAHREQQISGVATELQGSATMEDLLALAAEQFNEVLGSSRAHIRLQLAAPQPANLPAAGYQPDIESSNGGGVA